MNSIEQTTHTSLKEGSDLPNVFGDRRQVFRRLHSEGCFVIPNPWDVGSARYLQHLGFLALATTSAGFAFSQGLPDSDIAVSLDRSLSHIAEITAAVDLPVNADFASGYGIGPSDVADSVMRCVATGIAGLSIEDATGDPSDPLYDLPIALERVKAARQAIDQSGSDVLLTARAECYLVGHPDAFRESVHRLQAYAQTIWINDWGNIHDEFEEGGFKQSGPGRLRGQEGLDDFLECKHIAFKPGSVKGPGWDTWMEAKAK